MMRKRKVPVLWTPSLKLTLIDLPFCSDDPSMTDNVEFSPPPLNVGDIAGGLNSSVVASTFTLHGVVATLLEAKHVPASLMGKSPVSAELVSAPTTAALG